MSSLETICPQKPGGVKCGRHGYILLGTGTRRRVVFFGKARARDDSCGAESRNGSSRPGAAQSRKTAETRSRFSHN